MRRTAREQDAPSSAAHNLFPHFPIEHPSRQQTQWPSDNKAEHIQRQFLEIMPIPILFNLNSNISKCRLYSSIVGLLQFIVPEFTTLSILNLIEIRKIRRAIIVGPLYIDSRV